MDSLPKLSRLRPFRNNFCDLWPARDVPEFSRYQGLGSGCGQGAIVAPRGRPRGQPPQNGDQLEGYLCEVRLDHNLCNPVEFVSYLCRLRPICVTFLSHL